MPNRNMETENRLSRETFTLVRQRDAGIWFGTLRKRKPALPTYILGPGQQPIRGRGRLTSEALQAC